MASDEKYEHYCKNIQDFPLDKFLQLGSGNGSKVLIIGEAPAPNGWRKSGRAFYTPEGKLLPTGRNLNQLLYELNLSVESCAFTELIKCFVGKDRKLLDICGQKCWPIFLKQLRFGNYKLIIVLGVKTLEILNRLLNTDINIGKLSEVVIEGKSYVMLPIYHPSPIAPFNHKKNIEIFSAYHNTLKQMLV